MIRACLVHPSANVRSAATKAFVSFLTFNEDDDKLVKGFSPDVPAILEVCRHVVSTEEDDDGPLQALADLVAATPKVVIPHIDAIVVLCSTIIENAEVDESYRNSAMEVLTSLCETAPNSIKKRAPHVSPVILQSALILMTELDESVEEWLLVDDVDEGDIEEDVAAVGETSLDRISCALNGKAILQPFFEAIEKLLADGDWRKRHAALMAISAVGEGSKRAMEPVIDKVVDTVAPFLQDSHPRVRHAACNAMGQMATDFSPNLQKKCHEKTISGLLNLLNDTSCYRVCAHAGAALVNFSEDCPQQVITPYLPAIMQKLEYVLETTFSILQEKGNKIVLEQIITTIASVADAAKEVFVQFYDRLMPPLKYILQHSGDTKFKILRGKTIECISLIGLAVGKDKFGNDAVERIVSHQQHFVTLLLKGLTDEYAEVRQAAAYGLGVMALKGGAEFHDSVVTALEPLAVMINKPDARATENNAVATENAIAAVAKILRHANVKMNVDQVIPTFLGWLPTYEDEEESIHIYSYLCDLIESNNPVCLGTDNSNLPQILDIILTAFIMGAFNDEAVEVKGRLVNILKMMQQNNVLERIFSTNPLDDEKRSKLQELLSA